MQRKALLKDTWAEIWKTKSRYLSILAIVALGTGFFAGIKATSPAMKATAQEYYASHNLLDLRVVSTLGLTEEDVTALRQREDVRAAQSGYSFDAFAGAAGQVDVITRVYSMGDPHDENALNRYDLVEGRLPERPDECLADNSVMSGMFEVGNKITLHLGDDEIDDMLHHREFTIVGRAQTPLYVSFERGSSNIGNGNINSFLLLMDEAFALDVYTDIYLTLEDTAALPFHAQAYTDVIERTEDALEPFGEERARIRFEDIHAEALAEIEDAQAELDDGIAEYEDGKRTFDEEIADAEAELADAKEKIAEGEEDLADARRKLEDARRAYSKGKKELDAQQAQLEGAQAELDAAQSQLDQSRRLVASVQGIVRQFATTFVPSEEALPSDVAAAIAASAALSEAAGADLPALLTRYVRSPLSPAKEQLGNQLLRIAAGASAQLDAAAAELQQNAGALNEGWAQLDAGKAQLQSARRQITSAEDAIVEGEAELADAKVEYEDGLLEYEDAKADGERELADAEEEIRDAEQKLADARQELDDLPQAEWYIFNRTNNVSYSNYLDDAERIDRIAMVFPVFFIIVAALVCLTTMSRMVAEQRTQIGVLKALGYSGGEIVSKYLIYAISASVLGSLIGLSIGFWVFPTVIFNAYRILYDLPDVIITFRWDYALWCTLAAVAVTSLSAAIACKSELMAAPSQLMRPKPPKSGKRVFLERLSLWRRLGFLTKVTIRNLFRYKSRILMTIVGISGCTALLVTGFGMRDSVTSIADMQYGRISLYDMNGYFDDGAADEDLDAAQSLLAQDASLSGHMLLRYVTSDISSSLSTKSITLIVPMRPEALDPFVKLQDRRSGQALALGEGVILTEKLGKMLGVGIGDAVTFYREGNRPVTSTVAGLAENYVLHSVYMTPAEYERIFAQSAQPNAFFANLAEGADGEDIVEQLLKNDAVLSVMRVSSFKTTFSGMMNALNYIVWVLIASASGLAFVVLYNLANINVNERVRELATLKVLGFYDGEVSAYIYRENTISALLGTGVGLLLGIPLERFVMQTVEVEVVMFPAGISGLSFALAAALTIAFTLAVNFALHFRLKKLSMVESLKSIE